MRLYFNDKLICEDWTDHAPITKEAKVKLEEGKFYNIKMEFYENSGGAVAKLGWKFPDENTYAEAVNAAKNSDAVLLFVGDSENIESEGFDRDNIDLPAGQDNLIQEVSKANKNVVVVLSTGSPVTMDKWINNVNGIIETWFGGQEMSRAIYDVLTGAYTPSGKLPVTFPNKWEDCSAFNTYKAKDSVTEYSDGIYVGYRHFEKDNIKPLFPFGYGLSYTTFDYKNLKITKDGNMVKAAFEIINTGKAAGAEVAELYVRDIESKVDRPVKELKGFKKVYLNPGESKPVEITLDESAFSYFDPETNEWALEPGEFEIQVGASSKDIKLKDSITL